MYVVVNVRYQRDLIDWAHGLRYPKPAKIGGEVVEVNLEFEIANALSFLSGPDYSAEEVRLEFDEGNILDRPQAELRIEILATGQLPESKILAALDKIIIVLRGRLPLANLYVVLRVGEHGFAKQSLPDKPS
jgi:hypothetical protein